MIAYVTLGADDMAAAEQFYTALLLPLGYRLDHYQGDLSFIPPDGTSAPDLYIKRPFDGAAATAGNGTMIALEAPSQGHVRKLHASAVAAGGSDEGAPGFRDAYSADFYVAYLRDPQGNKLAVFSTSP
ncbi:VOC family protein [Gymnodinialimonas hymeniacidonis]|uniref:VOC family protein n=1 Tax=Gymnodinialimonas hymeniacidonis TaxID=3126508 RepID=UPI0034C6D7D7